MPARGLSWRNLVKSPSSSSLLHRPAKSAAIFCGAALDVEEQRVPKVVDLVETAAGPLLPCCSVNNSWLRRVDVRHRKI